MTPAYRHALIIGAGAGLSASLARLFHARGLKVSLAARDPAHLQALAAETVATTHRCDAADHAEVAALFASLDGIFSSRTARPGRGRSSSGHGWRRSSRVPRSRAGAGPNAALSGADAVRPRPSAR